MQPEQDQKILPSQLALVHVGTDSSARNESNCQTHPKIVNHRNDEFVNVATTEVVSTINDVVVGKDVPNVIVDNVQLGLNDDSIIKKVIDSLPATTSGTMGNVMNSATTPDTILAPPYNDDANVNRNVEAAKVPPIDLDAFELSSTAAAPSPPSTVPSIVKISSTYSTADVITNYHNNTRINVSTIDMDMKSGNMDLSKVSDSDVTNTVKSMDNIKDTTTSVETVPPAIGEHGPLREDDYEKVHHHSASDRTTGITPTNCTNADSGIDGMIGATVHERMTIDPLSAVDEMISESNRSSLDNEQECLPPPTESAISQIPIESNISSAITENVRSTLNQIDDKHKFPLDIIPQAVSTMTTEGEKASSKDDNRSESTSLTNKLKRVSPHTLPSQSDEPPKKKLTIRIPLHKMKPKSLNADIVTTPKSIHISSGGRKEVTETYIGSSSTSQPSTDALSSNVEMTNTSAMSPRQSKKLALKQERKRQKMIDQKNSREVETSQTIANDTTESMLNDKSKGMALPTKNPTGHWLTPTTETNETDDNQILLERQTELEANELLVSNADGAIDSVILSATTTEENVAKKKKKGVRRKAMEGDSDPKTSKETEIELDDSQWVQCDECGKWRIIPTRVVQELPKQWYCRDNVYDPKHSSCDAPEQTDKEVAKEKKRRLKKKQRLLKTAEEVAAAAVSLSLEPGTHSNVSATVTENPVERSPRPPPPRELVVDTEKGTKQQKSLPSTEKSHLPELPLTTAESRPPKKEKKIASTVKKGRSTESMDKLLPPSEEAVGAVTDVVKPRGRGRPRRANNATVSANISTTKESIPIVGPVTSAPTPPAAEDGENLEWVQCEKCDKWRKLPPHVSADDLPDVWTCTMNRWNPSSASCDAAEDKSDGLQDIGVFGTNGSAAGKLTYRHLIFGSNGRKANRPISEKTCAAESIFSAHFDEDVVPTKVLYADSSAYISRGRPNISVDDNEGMSVFELMSHSKLWQELRGMSSPSEQPGHPPSTSLHNNDTLRMNAYTYDTLPTDVQGQMKDYVIRALDTDTLSGDEVVRRMQQSTNTTLSAIDESILPYCTATVIVTTLCDLVKIGTVECIQKIGNTAMTDCWNPHYRRKVQRVTPINDQHHQLQQRELLEKYTTVSSLSNASQELQQQRRRLSFPMKLSKPWKHAKIHE